MQGVYFKVRPGPWWLARRTRSVPDAERLVKSTAKWLGEGRIRYIEAPTLPWQVKDFRHFAHRRLGAWKCTGTIYVAK
jgi:hypothetical protein